MEWLEALIFDVDGTLADTEEAHRQAFNAAFVKLELGWNWEPDLYARLLRVSGGQERVASYIETLPLALPADEQRALAGSAGIVRNAISELDSRA